MYGLFHLTHSKSHSCFFNVCSGHIYSNNVSEPKFSKFHIKVDVCVSRHFSEIGSILLFQIYLYFQ